jgi:SPP1 gp7 family putative phage head morphogenesis protein
MAKATDFNLLPTRQPAMTDPTKTRDDRPSAAERRAARERFATAQRVEAEYMRSLRQLTRQVDHMVRGMAGRDNAALERMLRQYSEIVEPWAKTVAEKMVADIARRDATAWSALGRSIGRSLKKELQTAPVGHALQGFLGEQVRLITSLPLEAAERVHKLTTEGLVSGRRAEEITRDILETGGVTESRARLIARTEIARTASGLTMARAQHVGSTHYIWRTVGDSDTRKSHKAMNGVVVPWASPPVLSDGTTTHAGMIYYCRCYPEPILTEL